MRILLLGNGFDLEHDLPTKYRDFLAFMYMLEKEARYPRDKLFVQDLETIDIRVKELITHLLSRENRLADELLSYTKSFWIRYFTDVYKNLGEGWIDFELEISAIVQKLNTLQNTYTGKKIRDLKKDDLAWLNVIFESDVLDDGYSFTKYINIKRKFLIDDLSILIHSLEIYLSYIIEKLPFGENKDFTRLKFDKVLSFNYTETYDRAYGIGGDLMEVSYIHGKADYRSNPLMSNMVLGIDEYLPEEEKSRDISFIAFKKYYQRIHRKTGSRYKHWIQEIKESDELNNELVIYGHSLDYTDRDILEELIKCPNMKTKVFYYDKDDYGSKIANLVKVLGQDYLIENVEGVNPSIKFIDNLSLLPKTIEHKSESLFYSPSI